MQSDEQSNAFLRRIRNLSPKRLALLAVELQRRLASREDDAPEPIAIVGMACRTPGGAESPEEFWKILASGRDAIEKIPMARWDADAFYDPRPDTPGKAITRHAGFVRDIENFDPVFFGISPREAPGMDPQHRMLLEVAWEALENAGERADRLEESATGVFIGASSSDYEQLVLQSDESALNAYSGSGLASSVAAGRLSHFLGLRGPNLAVDTACSASGVAIHLACQSLRGGECARALAGGVNLVLMPAGLVILSQAHMLAADGRCKTFSTSADGFGRAEGCGILVLKRLSDAQADGDRILALIRGTAINHDGRSSGLTAPNGPAQEAVIKAALSQARLHPADVDYIEAHGTGTVLGDAIEIGALRDVFAGDRVPDRPLLLGSVKTNVGHLEAAAGVTGVLKVVLALQHECLPPHLHLVAGSGNDALDGLPFEVTTSLRPWPRTERPRIAGISSFGFSGTNCHLIVEEAPASENDPSPADLPFELMTVSAKTPEALAALCGRYAGFLRDRPETPLSDFAWTANGCRTPFQHRAAFVASSAGDAARQFEELASGSLPKSPSYRFAALYHPPPIAFLFTGQGSQYTGMGRAFYQRNAAFHSAMDQCDRVLEGKRQHRVSSVIFGDPSVPGNLIDNTAWTQPALFAFEYATAMMWQSWGIRPSIVLGHSLGEYVAACVAGILSLEEALTLAAERGRLMGDLPDNGSMLAVLASEDAVMAVLGSLPDSISVAAVNGPHSIVLSGLTQELNHLGARLAAAGIRSQPLATSHAFHSPLMEPMLDAFERQAQAMTFAEPRIKFVSNVTGRVLPSGQTVDAAYWRRHVRGTVRFSDGTNALLACDPGIIVEIGPAPVLLGMVKAAHPDMTVPSFPALRRGRDAWQCAFEALQHACLAGAPVDWDGVYRDRPKQKLALPTYPFQRQRYWAPVVPRTASKTSSPGMDVGSTGNPLDPRLYRIEWSITEPTALTGHHVSGPVLLAGEGGGQARMKDALRNAGIAVQDLIAGSAGSLFTGSTSEHLAQIRGRIRDSLQIAEPPRSVVLLLPHRPEEVDIPAAALQNAAAAAALLQEVIDAGAGRPDVWLVTRGAFHCGDSDRLNLPDSVVGPIAKVARLEHPGLRICHADMPLNPAAADYDRIASLLRNGTEEHTVASRLGGIAVPRLVGFNATARPGSRVTLQPGSAYMVTGAFGALGLRTAQWLAERGASELYLVGRSEPSPAARARIAEFEAAGIRVFAVTADISKPRDIARLSALIADAASQLRGIVHAAGLLDDGILLHQTPERFAKVFAPKISGGWLLHEFSLQYPLDFFVMFGSAAALLGQAGQSNYAASNAFLDALAEMRHRQGLPATSVAWGAWSEIGMATRVRTPQRAASIGIGSISPDRGIALQEEAILSGVPALAALSLDWKLFFASRTAHHDLPMLKTLAAEFQPGSASAGGAGTLASLIDRAPAAERLGVIREYLRARLASVLMLPPAYPLREDQPFAELGLDSLMALELKNELQSSAGVALPPTFLFEYPTLGLAATYLDALMAGTTRSEPANAEASGYEEIVL